MWGRPQIDLFATRFNNKLPTFLSLLPDQAVDALSLHWETLEAKAFPPVSLLGKVLSKVMDQGCRKMILIAPGWPNMSWFWDLGNLSSQLTSSSRGPVDSPFQRGLPPQPQESELTCLAPRAAAIEEQGFSDEVATIIEAPQRTSTRAIYKSKWAVFVKWCKSNEVDFGLPSVAQVADFLMHLFQDRKLQPSTIDGYRTAIEDMIGNDKRNVGKDENLTRLLDSFHRDKPKGRRGVLTWNLSLVLQLTKPTFEPMRKASLKHLTFRTVFLLALGSGKRRSEIHAWLYRNISHQENWSKVSLYPFISFLSKNQLAKDDPSCVAPVVIPALAPTLDDSLKQDKSLCPVRALRYYLDRTKDLLEGQGPVFCLLQEEFPEGYCSCNYFFLDQANCFTLLSALG